MPPVDAHQAATQLRQPIERDTLWNLRFDHRDGESGYQTVLLSRRENLVKMVWHTLPLD